MGLTNESMYLIRTIIIIRNKPLYGEDL